MHLKERMHALEEKNTLSQELEKTRNVMEDVQREKVILFINRLLFKEILRMSKELVLMLLYFICIYC